MKSPSLLPHALTYAKTGLSVIPLNGKRPFGEWDYYQSMIASDDQIKIWWSLHRQANIGVVTGNVSRLVVIDFDYNAKLVFAKSYPLLVKYLGESFVVSKTGKGYHCLIRTQDAATVRNMKIARENKRVLIETRGEGGYIVAPPSIHPEYKTQYQFTNCKRLGDVNLVSGDAIMALIDDLRSTFNVDKELEYKPPSCDRQDFNGELEVININSFVNGIVRNESLRVASAGPGGRNDILFRAAAKLSAFRPYIDDAAIYEALLTASTQNGYVQDDGAASAVKTIRSAMKAAIPVKLIENPFKGMGIF